MIPQNQTRFRRLILIGTPILTATMLLFHPLPEAAETGMTELPEGLALYELMAPIAEGFLIVHLLFPLALALLGLSVILLLNGVQGITATISRVSASCALTKPLSLLAFSGLSIASSPKPRAANNAACSGIDTR